MRVPVEWLKEYTDVAPGVTGQDIAASLVRAGLEDEGVHGGDVTGPLVAGRVLERIPEPQKNGKVINWCQVDVGQANGTGEPQGIVCGAHNFDAGDLVVVCLPGAVLPGDFRISARKTYGHTSAGMICSQRELGLGEDHDGIIVLPRLLGEEAAARLQPGDDVMGVLGLGREVVEVEVTPDRGYCMSLRGIAREYSHQTGSAFRDPADVEVPAANGSGHGVRIEDDAPIRGEVGCDRYVARVVRGVDCAAASPFWLQQRLTEAGMRPISLAVDVTNYVMLALGQPLHAFDLATLTGDIVVRRARKGETMTTLDDVERTLDPEDLLITDGGERPLAMAGVMGGADSEVTDATRDVLIEAAHFHSVSVSRTSRRHGLISESSKRFERGVDPQLPERAAQLAVDVLVELGGGTADEGVTVVGEAGAPEPIRMPASLPGRLIGVELDSPEVSRYLTMIGCAVSDDGAELVVTPPSWRGDLTRGADLVEEVARLHGYDAIPSVVPPATGGAGLPFTVRAQRAVANALVARGFSEAMPYPFVGEKEWAAMGYAEGDPRRQATRLVNPASDEKPYLRTTVLSSLVEAGRTNLSRGARDLALFEIGHVVGPVPGSAAAVPEPAVRPTPEQEAAIRASVPEQPLHLAAIMAGEQERSTWSTPGRPVAAQDAIAAAVEVGALLGVAIEPVAGESAPWHPGRCAELRLDGTGIGHAGELHPKRAKELGLPERSCALELDLGAVLRAAAERVEARSISTMPVATSDVALVVPVSVTAGELEATLREGAGELLESLRLFDIYAGEHLPPGTRSLAYRMVFRAPDRTLKTEEVNAVRDAAVALAGSRHGAAIRA